MKVNSNVRPVVFNGQDYTSLTISSDNMGEPYRDGIQFVFENDERQNDYISGFFEQSEVERLHSFLSEYLNKSPGLNIDRYMETQDSEGDPMFYHIPYEFYAKYKQELEYISTHDRVGFGTWKFIQKSEIRNACYTCEDIIFDFPSTHEMQKQDT